MSSPITTPLISPRVQFLDSNGAPLAGGKLYSYAAGTNNPIPTYTDATGSVPNPNPVILDSAGSATVWIGSQRYKFSMYSSDGSLLWTIDDVISGGPQGDTGPQGIPGEAATVAVGSVSTGDPGSSAAVVNSGTAQDAIFDFTIPSGVQGPRGQVGYTALYETTAQVQNSGNTTENTIYTSPALAALVVGQCFHVKLSLRNNSQNITTATNIKLKINGTTIDTPQLINADGFAASGEYSLEYRLGARTGGFTTISRQVGQSQNAVAGGHAQQGMIDFVASRLFDMTAGTNTFTVTSKSGANADSQTFEGLSIVAY